MGTKFANLHIKTINHEVILDALQRLSNKAGSILATPDYSAMSIIDQYVYRSSNEKQINKTASSVSFYLNQEMSWSNVLNDHFSWGTVEQIGELLSNFVSEPVMTIGFFDEDIFEFTLFQEGEIKTKKYFCEEWAIEEYGLVSEVIDLDYLESVLELNHEEITKLLELRNPEQAIDELSRMIQINLWVHSEWISEDNEIEERYSKLELKIM
ncbi:hypothetical protein GC096_32805 [Paenibacillus sp. LMG 31461]|uniref:Uncharacterized protein n=1 Tax=Paenibacillus plantarum TaxID=2654975 RepID=A0ABX1XJT3_9BACL|nr:hypothetical protein [Paenibacillus plantarum]NOU68805.1 hypothetical protein [Paenibacillus plantarum]